MKVAHFIPAYRGAVHVEVALALAREATHCAVQGWTHMPFYVDATGIARARNLAVAHAAKHEADLLLMQDADVFALPTATYSALEVMEKTMRERGAAVVGAVALVRNGVTVNCEPARPGEAYPGHVGTGLMLIDMRRLRDVPRPWFVHRDVADGTAVFCGEDIYFCRHVEAHGHVVVVDYTFPVGHAYHVVEATKTE